MYLLEKLGQLDLHTQYLVTKRIHAHFRGNLKSLTIVFDRVFGLQIDVLVVEGAAEFGCYGFGIGFEVADDVGLVDVIDVDEHAHTEKDT